MRERNRRNIKPQIQEAQGTPSRINMGEKNLYIGILYSNYRKIKSKEEILNKAREKHSYRGVGIKITLFFSSKTMHVSVEQNI